MPKGRLVIIGIVVVIVVGIVLGFFGLIPIFKKQGPADPYFPTAKVTLKMWGTDPVTSFQDIIKAYQAQNPTVTITYTQQDPSEYEQRLVVAMAQGVGPDIFEINNLWVPEYHGLMASTASLPAGSAAMVTPQMMASIFPDVVVGDFVQDGSVYASPLYLDALALYYNKDIFNANGIVAPPATWDDLIADANGIKKITQSKALALSGVALGTSQNIAHAVDILSALMLQGKGYINSGQNGFIQFNKHAIDALSFYTQFADPSSDNYSWNNTFPDSRTAFLQGKTAMVIDYADFRDAIKKQNPFFNFGTSILPQLAGASASDMATFGRYVGVAASVQSPNKYVAWHFIKFLTTTPSMAGMYLGFVHRLPALTSLIQQGFGGDDAAFLRSFLIAKTWREPNESQVASILSGAIEKVVAGKMNVAQVLSAAQEAINQLW
jgi:ABC-type glycerol-3-phosphate transport system substrate-binding protein